MSVLHVSMSVDNVMLIFRMHLFVFFFALLLVVFTDKTHSEKKKIYNKYWHRVNNNNNTNNKMRSKYRSEGGFRLQNIVLIVTQLDDPIFQMVSQMSVPKKNIRSYTQYGCKNVLKGVAVAALTIKKQRSVFSPSSSYFLVSK